VAKALDAGLDGLFADKARSPRFLLRLILSPELMVTGFLRHRAAAMAWTPGIVLDYARALRQLIIAMGGPSGEAEEVPALPVECEGAVRQSAKAIDTADPMPEDCGKPVGLSADELDTAPAMPTGCGRQP
jgi:hypothetical protein